MSKEEKVIWEINIENASSRVCSLFGSNVAFSVFQRYDASEFSGLNPCYYSEVFAELEQIANDK